MTRVRQPVGNRLIGCIGALAFILIGLIGVFGQGPEFDGWGNRLFFAIMSVLAALMAWRAWTAALWTEDGCLVSRGFVRTRRFPLADLREVDAVQSDWLLYWIISVSTEDRVYYFEDVRDYPWRAGRVRMERVGQQLRAEAVAAGARLQDPAR